MNSLYKLYKKLLVRLRRRDKDFKTVMPTYGNIDIELLYSSPYDRTSIVPSIIYYISFDNNNYNTHKEYESFKKILSINNNTKIIENEYNDKFISAISIIGDDLYYLKRYNDSSYNEENIFLNMILKDISSLLPSTNNTLVNNIFNMNIDDISEVFTYDPIYTNTALKTLLSDYDEEYNIVCINGLNIFDKLKEYFMYKDILELISIDYVIDPDTTYTELFKNELPINGIKDPYMLNLSENYYINNSYLSDIIKYSIIYNDDFLLEGIYDNMDHNIFKTLYNKYMKILNNKSVLEDDYNDIDEII